MSLNYKTEDETAWADNKRADFSLKAFCGIFVVLTRL